RQRLRRHVRRGRRGDRRRRGGRRGGRSRVTEQRRFTEPDPAAAGSGPDTGVDEAEQVESELDEARRAAEEYLGDLRRLAADFDNYRKRVARDQAAQASRATESFVSELLPVLDNLERALDASEHHEEIKVA